MQNSFTSLYQEAANNASSIQTKKSSSKNGYWNLRIVALHLEIRDAIKLKELREMFQENRRDMQRSARKRGNNLDRDRRYKKKPIWGAFVRLLSFALCLSWTAAYMNPSSVNPRKTENFFRRNWAVVGKRKAVYPKEWHLTQAEIFCQESSDPVREGLKRAPGFG